MKFISNNFYLFTNVYFLNLHTFWDSIRRTKFLPLRRLGGVELASVGGIKNNPRCANEGLLKEIGNDLLFHRLGSTIKRGGLTSLFGMGRGEHHHSHLISL